MKGALLSTDRIITVSEHYAWEITQPAHGVGLHSILEQQRSVLYGIVNGINHVEWDPSTDPLIPANYSSTDLRGKAECKSTLLRSLKVGMAERTYLKYRKK